MYIINPNIYTNNRFSIFADCLITDTDNQKTNIKPITDNIIEHKDTTTNTSNRRQAYKHEVTGYLKEQIRKFEVEFVSNKLKIMFNNVNNFTEFKTICKKENIEFRTYTIISEKATTVVLKDLIRLPVTRRYRMSGPKTSFVVTEMPTHTKYPIYRLTFAPGTSLSQIKHTRYIEHIKIYWEKYENPKPTVHCFRCRAHSHTSANCNKKVVCFKCVGAHYTRNCNKTRETPATCANCKGDHTANFSKFPALLDFLSKRNPYTNNPQLLLTQSLPNIT